MEHDKLGGYYAVELLERLLQSANSQPIWLGHNKLGGYYACELLERLLQFAFAHWRFYMDVRFEYHKRVKRFCASFATIARI